MSWLCIVLLLSYIHSGVAVYCSNSTNERECGARAVAEILSAFTTSGVEVQDLSATSTEISNAIQSFTGSCLGVVGSVLRPIRLLSPNTNTGLLQQLSNLFTSDSGWRVQYTVMDLERIAQEVEFQMKTSVSLYDSWILDVPSSEAVLRGGGVAALDRLAAAGPTSGVADDDDVHPYFKRYAATYGFQGARTAVVLSGQVPLLYWRRDVLASYGLTSAPATWDDLLAVATAINGTDLDGDGRGDPALCWYTQGCYDAGTVLSAILAPLTQQQGSTSGWLLDPDTMQLLGAAQPGSGTSTSNTGGAGGSGTGAETPPQRALRMFRALHALQAPNTGSPGCPYLHTRFLTGSCAFTIKWAQQFKASQLQYPELRGRVGVAPLPGWSEVWDRATRTWVSCDSDTRVQEAAEDGTLRSLQRSPPPPPPTRQQGQQVRTLCPHAARAMRVVPEQLKRLSDPATLASPPGIANASQSQAAQSDTPRASPPTAASTAAPATPVPYRWGRVNRAPFTGMTALLGAVDARAPNEYAEAAFRFFVMIASPESSWQQLTAWDSPVGPFRRPHLDTANTGRWLEAGYDPRDLQDFLTSTSFTLDHPNAALPLRLPAASRIRDALTDAAWVATNSMPAVPPPSTLALAAAAGGASSASNNDGGAAFEARVAAALVATIRTAVEEVGPLAETRRTYRMTLGYPPDPAPSPPLVQSPASSGRLRSVASRVVVGVCVGVGGTAVLLAICYAVVLVGERRRRRALARRSLFGRTLAPGASPSTSLVVTDIVDSTRLWETVPTTIMSRCVQLHHDAIRGLLKEYGGYESATEGDSFILAFHCAPDAVAFAVRAQAALLAQPWPQELLEAADVCYPVWVQSLLHSATPERPNRSTLGSRLLPSRQHTAIQAKSSSLTHSLALSTFGSRGHASPFSTATAQPAAVARASPLNLGQTMVNVSSELHGVVLRASSRSARRHRNLGASVRPLSQPMPSLEGPGAHSGPTTPVGLNTGAMAATDHVAHQPMYGNPGTAPLPPMPLFSSWAPERLMQHLPASPHMHGAPVVQPSAVAPILLRQPSSAAVVNVAAQQQQQLGVGAASVRGEVVPPGHGHTWSGAHEESLPSMGACRSTDGASGPPPGFEDISDEFATCSGPGPGAGSFAFADPRTSAPAVGCKARDGSGGDGTDVGDLLVLAMLSTQRDPPPPPPPPLAPPPAPPVSPRDQSPTPRSLRKTASQLLIIPEAAALGPEGTPYQNDGDWSIGANSHLSQLGHEEASVRGRSGGGGGGRGPTGQEAVAAAIAPQQQQQQPNTPRHAGSPYQGPGSAGQEATWGAVTSASASVASASAAYHLSSLDSTSRSQTNPLRDHVRRSTSIQQGGTSHGQAPGEEGALPKAGVRDISAQANDAAALQVSDAQPINVQQLRSGDGGRLLDHTMDSLLESAFSTIAHTAPQVQYGRGSMGPGLFGDGGWPGERAEGDGRGSQRVGSTGQLPTQLTHGPSMELPMPPASPVHLQPHWQQREWERARGQSQEVMPRQRPRHHNQQQLSQSPQQSLLARVVAAGRSHPGERTGIPGSGSPGGGGGSSGGGGGRVRRGVRSAARLFSAAVASVGGSVGGRDSIRRASSSSCSHSATTLVLSATLRIASVSTAAAATAAGTGEAEGHRTSTSRVNPLDMSSDSDVNADATSGGGTDPGAAAERRRRKHGRERSSSNGGSGAAAAGVISRSLTAAAVRRAVSIRSIVQPADAKQRPASGSSNGGALSGVSARRANVGTGLMSLLQASTSVSGRGGRRAPTGQPSVGQLLMQAVTGGGMGSQNGFALLSTRESSMTGPAPMPPPPPVKTLTFAEYLAFVFRPLPCGMAAAQQPGTATEDSVPLHLSRMATSPVRSPAGALTRPSSTSASQALATAAACSSPTSPRHVPGAVRVFGGLRVRMGVHSGVTAECVSYSRVAGRTQYSGSAMDTAKAVCDAAQGGMVLLSPSALAQYNGGGGGGRSGGADGSVPLLLYMGRHALSKAGDEPMELVMALTRELLPRMPLLGPVRSDAEVEAGALGGPLGEVSFAALAVAGLPTLMAWDQAVTADALALFRSEVTGALARLGGQPLDAAWGEGRLLAAFMHPCDAVRWAAVCEAALKEAPWSEELLSHELCEAVEGEGEEGQEDRERNGGSGGEGELPLVDRLTPTRRRAALNAGQPNSGRRAASASPRIPSAPTAPSPRLLFRGLRLRGAVDCCPVRGEVQPGTGRLSYRTAPGESTGRGGGSGSVAAGVLRLAAYASTGQVLCTGRAWRRHVAAAGAPDAAAAYGSAHVPVCATSIGTHQVRGLGDKMELWAVHYSGPDDEGKLGQQQQRDGSYPMWERQRGRREGGMIGELEGDGEELGGGGGARAAAAALAPFRAPTWEPTVEELKGLMLLD